MAFKGWEKVRIKTDRGEMVEGIAPVIISASRSTDIPAFYAKWFINRLNAGYVRWINPFNRRSQYVSFEKARLIVFWSKNPAPIMKYLREIDERGINYYFQFTLNDYEDEGFEPNVPPLKERISTFKELSDMIGKEKVIWRFDPLILTKELDVKKLLDKIYKVGSKIHRYTDKLVISFADIGIYAKVRRNLKKANINYIEFDRKTMEEIAESIQRINKEWGLEIATCAEEVDLDKYSIKHNKCIDDELIIKLFRKDRKLMEFLGVEEKEFLFPVKRDYLKDKGQRKFCGCIVSKDIGQYNTCGHLCVYCYANYSKEVVLRNLGRHDENSDSIV